MNTRADRSLIDLTKWREFIESFEGDPDQFIHVPGLIIARPLLRSVLNATEKLRACDHNPNPRLRVFSGNRLDYAAIERFCYDTPPSADVFEFLEEWVSGKGSCIAVNEVESWDATLREVAATEFIPGLRPYLRRTSSKVDWYAFLATEGWTPFGIHDDDEPSLIMNLGPADKEVWVWEPSALSGLDRGRRTSLSFEHQLPSASYHLVLKPGDFAAIPTGWFHVLRSSGRSVLLGIALYRRDPHSEIGAYLSRRGRDPLEWFGEVANSEAARCRISAVRRHLDLTLESAAFSASPVRVHPVMPESGLPQRVRALLPLLVVELPTLLLANGAAIPIPEEVGAEVVAAWLRENPEFTPEGFTKQFPELPVHDGSSDLLNRLARAGVLSMAMDT